MTNYISTNLGDLLQTHLASGASSHPPVKRQQVMQQVEEEKQGIILQHGLCGQIFVFFQTNTAIESLDQQRTLQMEPNFLKPNSSSKDPVNILRYNVFNLLLSRTVMCSCYFSHTFSPIKFPLSNKRDSFFSELHLNTQTQYPL